MTSPTSHPTRIAVSTTVLAALVVGPIAPVWVSALLVWTLIAGLTAFVLCRTIANADRDCARQQGEGEPLSDRPSVIFVSTHDGGKY
jgi:hypothetical protein